MSGVSKSASNDGIPVANQEISGSKDRAELRVSVVAFRKALESVLAIKSDVVHFATVSFPRAELWMWGETSDRLRVTSLAWNTTFQVDTSLVQADALKLAKSPKLLQGTLDTHVEEHGCVIGGIVIPWTSESPRTPPQISIGCKPFFNLNPFTLRSLKPTVSLLLTRDYPERVLRLISDSEHPAPHVAAFGKWPDHDIESRFVVADFTLLVGSGKREATVSCDCTGDSSALRLISVCEVTADKWPISIWTVVKGEACPHPPRFVPEPDLFQELGFNSDNEPETPSNTSPPVTEKPVTQSDTSDEKSLDVDDCTNENQCEPSSTDDGRIPWTNFVWRPWGAGCHASGNGNGASPDQWSKPKLWDTQAQASGKPFFVYVDCGDSDLLDDDAALVPLRERVWTVMRECKNLVWQICTEQPENFVPMILEQPWYSAWPDHIWPGVLCTNQANAKLRVPELIAVPSKLHWILAQPLLELIDISNWINRIDWIVVGGDTIQRDADGNPRLDPRPIEPDWVRTIRVLCYDRKKCFFFSRWGDARQRKVRIVEVLGRNCRVPELYATTSTQIPGCKENFGSLQLGVSGQKTVTQDLHFEGVRNVGNDATNGVGVQILLRCGPTEPTDGSTFEVICAHIKALCAARETFEDEFDFRVAHLLLRAKRDFEKRDGDGDFDFVASELTGVAHTMVAVYVQIAREISREQWRQIPAEHRKVTHLLPLARMLKDSTEFSEALRTLDEPKSAVSASTEAANAVADQARTNALHAPIEPTRPRQRKNRKRESNGLLVLVPGAPALKDPLLGYDLSISVPADGVTSTREYLERVLREQPEQLDVSLAEARVRVQLDAKPAAKDI